MRALLGICSMTGLAACTPAAPTMDVAQAEQFCRAQVLKPVDTNVHLGVGIGTGGKVSTSGGISIGVNLDAMASPKAAYAKCVKKNAGVEATTPLRVEMQN